jgi:hypothetical protein
MIKVEELKALKEKKLANLDKVWQDHMSKELITISDQLVETLEHNPKAEYADYPCKWKGHDLEKYVDTLRHQVQTWGYEVHIPCDEEWNTTIRVYIP